MEKDVLIDCPRCLAKVQGKNLGESKQFLGTDWDDRTISGGIRVTLLLCPMCGEPIVGKQTLSDYEETDGFGPRREVWSDAERVWPESQEGLSSDIPEEIRHPLESARGCLLAKQFDATVVMTGKAMEALGRHFHAGDAERLMLSDGLEKLHTNKVIDDRLYSWGKELKEHRNLAAHPSGTKISRSEAEDLLSFGLAICDYVFVLQAKFDAFMQSKDRQKLERKSAADNE